MMIRTYLLGTTFLAVATLSSTLFIGCKKKEEPAVAPPPPAVPAMMMDAAMAPGTDLDSATFPLGAGEAYYTNGATATTPLEWKTADGTIVTLALITTGTDDKGRDKGVLRAWYNGNTQDVQTFNLDPKIDHWAELKPLANDRVLFRFGEADTGPSGRNAVILVWNGDGKEVRAAKRWRGEASEPEPAWLGTGTFVASPDSGDNCAKIVARVVACGKDEGFRTALVTREDEAKRADLMTHLDTHLTAWKKPAAVKTQCARWAGDDYVETHFGESRRLARLAQDTKMECKFFGAEIVDEGGLPRSALEAHPAK